MPQQGGCKRPEGREMVSYLAPWGKHVPRPCGVFQEQVDPRDGGEYWEVGQRGNGWGKASCVGLEFC